MSEKRYAIVRVEGRCPREAEMNWDIKCVPTLECDKCLTRINYGDTKIGQGRENAKRFIEENPEIYAEIEEKVRAMFIEDKSKDGEEE